MPFRTEIVKVPFTESPQEWAKADVENQGFNKMLGKGHWASVWGATGRDCVMKVLCCGDRGYPNYINLINEIGSPNNPFFPRIYGATLYQQMDSDDQSIETDRLSYMVVCLEKLRPGSRHGRNFFRGVEQINRLVHSYRANPRRYKLSPHLEEAMIVINMAYDIALEEDRTAIIDVYSKNVMSRKGQLVITDPVA